MDNPRANGTRSAKVISVIETVAKRGMGTKEDPVREVTQYWDLDGNFLAEQDPEWLVPLIECETKAVKDSISRIQGTFEQHKKQKEQEGGRAYEQIKL